MKWVNFILIIALGVWVGVLAWRTSYLYKCNVKTVDILALQNDINVDIYDHFKK